MGDEILFNFFFFFSSRRRHTRCREVSWARRCVQETEEMKIITYFYTGFMFVVSIISLFMHLFNQDIIRNGFEFCGSKGGLFENKNAISIAAAIAIVLCLSLIHI
eukprot:TRINITY_DN1878_c0_g1_i4.p1 TRINITY_DN1878_c0_g1~~TRINITY_DN1878_c0_g1_i4.p1  ORF type:complete len:105 (-),score=41.17 TRINITY_DN1878_c0_g1_i4:121-435(-)